MVAQPGWQKEPAMASCHGVNDLSQGSDVEWNGPEIDMLLRRLPRWIALRRLIARGIPCLGAIVDLTILNERPFCDEAQRARSARHEPRMN